MTYPPQGNTADGDSTGGDDASRGSYGQNPYGPVSYTHLTLPTNREV